MKDIVSKINQLKEQLKLLPKNRNGKLLHVSVHLREEILGVFLASGYTTQSFCQEIGLSYSSFAKWKRNSELNDSMSTHFDREGFQKVLLEEPFADGAGMDSNSYTLEVRRLNSRTKKTNLKLVESHVS
jgi:hypothetical protein